MKFNSALSLALAPVALAKSVRNKYPAQRRSPNIGVSGGGIGGNVALGVGAVPVAQQFILVWVNAGGPGAATQTINQQVTVTQTVTVPAGGQPSIVAGPGGVQTTIQPGSSAVIAGAPGPTHTVNVGGPNGLVFDPPSLKAEINDFVVFNFYSRNHTVTQAAFDTPCVPLAGGMDSGFMANADNIQPPPQVAMQVLVADPLWMYCAQGDHCGKGMTFAINDRPDRTAAQFQSNAITQFGQGLQQSGITGGSPAAAPAPDAAAPPVADPNAPAPVPGAPAPVADPLATASLGVAPSIASVAFDPLASAPIANGAGTLGGGIVMGVGTLNADGSCNCAVQCDASNAFPEAVQGVDSFGGVGGAISIGQAGVAPAASIAPLDPAATSLTPIAPAPPARR